MKRTVCTAMITLGVILALSLCSVSAAGTFRDVKESDWFYSGVQYAKDNGFMSGTGDGAFSPEAATTRGMIVTILHNIEGKPTPAGKCPFTDVKAGAWYENAVTWAAENKIVSGYSAERFGPEDRITREQMATILFNYAKAKNYDTETAADLGKFSDQGKISSYAVKTIAWAHGVGLISGTSATTLSPQDTATRAQAAVILSKFCQRYNDLSRSNGPWMVTFLLNYDGAGLYQTKSVEDGKTVERPADPMRTGYTFSGWTVSTMGGAFDFTKAVTENVVVYAQWTQEPNSSGGGTTGGSSSGGSSGGNPYGGYSGGSSSGGSSGGSSSGGSTSGSTQQPVEYPGIPAAQAGDSEPNVFLLTAVQSQDKKTVDVTLTLQGKVAVCGFDLRLCYDKTAFELETVDTDYDLQVYTSETAEAGKIPANYSGSDNLTKTRKVLKATFRVTDTAPKTATFWLEAVEIIQTNAQYDILPAQYTLTYCSVDL